MTTHDTSGRTTRCSMRSAPMVAVLFSLALFGQSPETSSPLGPATLAQAIRSGDAAALAAHERAGFGGDTITGASTATTALMLASVLGDSNAVAVLARSANQIDARESYLGMGETALMKSLLRGSEAGSLVLLAAGADPALTNAWGWNALHLAAYRGDALVIQRLLVRIDPVDARTCDGFTALHVAARHGQSAAVKLLLTAGADRRARTASGFTPLDLALLGPWPDVALLLGSPAKAMNEKTAPETSTRREGGRFLVALERREQAGIPAMRLEVEPASGGRILSWRVGARELLRPPDPRDGTMAGGIPLLFPTPNEVKECRLRLPEGEILMRNPDQPRPTALHGYAVDDRYSWTAPLADSNGSAISVFLNHDAHSVRWQAFPRSNTLSVTYRLGPKGLRIEYEITNRDRRTLPAGFGVHPYWTVGDESKLRVSVAHPRIARFDGGVRELLPAENALDLRAGRSMDQCPAGTVFFHGPGAAARLAWLDDPRINLELCADPALGYLILHKPGKGAYCVEHQGSAPDAHRMLAEDREKDAGLFVIPPGDRVRGWVEYRLLPEH